MLRVPLINGRSYGWSMIKLNLLGVSVNGFIKISYKDKVNKTNNKGGGQFATSRGQADYDAEASLTLEMKEVEAIQRALPPGKRLQDIAPFDITVSFVDDVNLLVNHVIKNAEFLENGRDMQAGDGSIEVELPLIVSHIEWNGAGTGL